ncbi:MAG TPA: diacylglycerol kinase family protein [Hanamia sp.]
MRFLKSFLFALNGLRDAIRHEKNFQIQCIVALLVIIAGIFFSISAAQWIAILICIAMVLSFEIMNSAIEKLCDFVCPSINPAIKKIKDLSAGAVLLSAIISFIVGCIIFIPKIKMLLHSV